MTQMAHRWKNKKKWPIRHKIVQLNSFFFRSIFLPFNLLHFMVSFSHLIHIGRTNGIMEFYSRGHSWNHEWFVCGKQKRAMAEENEIKKTKTNGTFNNWEHHKNVAACKEERRHEEAAAKWAECFMTMQSRRLNYLLIVFFKYRFLRRHFKIPLTHTSLLFRLQIRTFLVFGIQWNASHNILLICSSEYVFFYSFSTHFLNNPSLATIKSTAVSRHEKSR